MSLARTLMNGGYVGTLEANINPSRYGHSQGASVIAMESVEELHAIFLENYEYEQADLAAAIEGVALEGSQYEAVAEAAVKNVITKIKEFLTKLWAKVKAFFHEVKRYLDAIFMSGKDFAKKYEKEIRKIDNLKDFEYEMFEYDDKEIDSVDEYIANTKSAVEKVTNNVEGVAKEFFVNLGVNNSPLSTQRVKKVAGGEYNDPNNGTSSTRINEEIEALTGDDIDDKIISVVTNGKCKSVDDYDEHLFAKYRSGAKDSSDKESRELSYSDITKFLDTLLNTKASSTMDKVQSETDKMYKAAITTVDNIAKESAKKEGINQEVTRVLNLYSSYISKHQTYQNKMIKAWKSAVKERDGVYKSAIIAALSYDKKQAKNK